MATTDDRLLIPGSSPLERIYQQLVIITMVLREGFGQEEDDDTSVSGLAIPPMNPLIPINPNFTEPL